MIDPARTKPIDRLSPHVIDGDGIVCGETSVRLLAIDAPELHGCPRTRHCAPGDPVASRDSLQRLIAGRVVTFEPVTVDRYGRTVAIVRVGAVNASCHQIATGYARYWARYDRGGVIRRGCNL